MWSLTNYPNLQRTVVTEPLKSHIIAHILCILPIFTIKCLHEHLNPFSITTYDDCMPLIKHT